MTEQHTDRTGRESAAPAGARGANRFLDGVVLVIAGSIAATAAAALLGRLTGCETLTSFRPQWAPMEVSTAVAFLVLAAAVAARRAWIVSGCCGAVALLSAGALAMHAAGVGAGEPATPTSVCLFLLAAGGLATAAGGGLSAELILVVAGALATIAELAYWYGAVQAGSAAPLDAMGLTTTACGTLVCMGFLGRVRNGHTRWVFTGPDPGAHLLRRILPAALLGGPLAVVLIRVGHQLRLYSSGLVLPAAMETTVLVILVVALRSAAQTQRAEERIQADRERIAREVHEQVIGQIFLSSMQLARVLPAIDEPAVAHAVHRTVDDLDHTIRTLRNVIHPRLPSQPGGSDLETRPAELVSASRGRLSGRRGGCRTSPGPR